MGRSNLVMCPKCLNAYYTSQLERSCNGKYYCPSYGCAGLTAMFDIDELMYEPIKLLNAKGYKTAYCCSGHYNDPLAYIAFAGTKYMPETIPEGWFVDTEEIEAFKGTTIRNHDDSLAAKMENLYKWALELPINPKIDMSYRFTSVPYETKDNTSTT